MDRSVSGPLSVSVAAAAMMDDAEEQEADPAQPGTMAEEDEEGLSEAEVCHRAVQSAMVGALHKHCMAAR